MVDTLKPVKIVSNFVVSLALLIIYIYFFGQQSIRRYLASEVIIIEQEEKDVSIPQPGKVVDLIFINSAIYFPAITIFPVNPNTGRGRKDMADCQGNGNLYLKCMENITYSIEDVLYQNSSSGFRVKSFYLNDYEDMVHSLELYDGMVSHDYHLKSSHLKIELKKELKYKIFIMDPKIQFFNNNPDIFPRTRMDISENETRSVMFYLKVSYGNANDPVSNT